MEPRKFITEIRDPIHGFIPVYEEELKIIDSPTFQRLRKIKQLAMAYLVYPGAQHTRFEHSLGAMHLAGMMAEKLELNDDEKRLIRLSALLHDIGHMPFSHAAEEVIIKNKNVLGLESHEELSKKIIEECKDFNFLEKEMRKSITDVLNKSYNDKYVLCDVISGPIDIDKMDYLLRDCHYTGVQYGKYDPEQIIKNVVEIPLDSETEGHPLAISYEGLHAVEQFILARYFITQQVYYHRVRRITDLMLQKLLVESINIPEIKEILSLDSILSSYSIGDEELMLKINDKKEELSSKGKKLFDRLQSRHLLKEIFIEQNIEKIINDDTELDIIRTNKNNYESRVSQKIAEEFKFDKELVFAKIYKEEPVLSSSYENNKIDSKEFEKFYIVTNAYKKEFTKISKIFKSELPNPESSLHVYAPLDDIEPDMNSRKKWIKDNKGKIEEIIRRIKC